MAAYLAYAVTGVGGDAVSESLFAVADSDNTLAVSIPCDVVYAAGYDVVFSFRVLRSLRVPDSYAAADIARCYVEAGRGETSYCCLGSVLSILF